MFWMKVQNREKSNLIFLITNLVSAMTVADELGALKPYFADGVAETEQEKMDELHAIFHRDFLRIP